MIRSKRSEKIGKESGDRAYRSSAPSAAVVQQSGGAATGGFAAALPTAFSSP